MDGKGEGVRERECGWRGRGSVDGEEGEGVWMVRERECDGEGEGVWMVRRERECGW